MSTSQGLFRLNKNDQELIEALDKAFNLYAQSTVSTFSVEEAAQTIDLLKRRRLIRWYVLRAIKDEMRAEGLSTAAIDWENIGDFLVKIAPIIFELIRMFM